MTTINFPLQKASCVRQFLYLHCNPALQYVFVQSAQIIALQKENKEFETFRKNKTQPKNKTKADSSWNKIRGAV